MLIKVRTQYEQSNNMYIESDIISKCIFAYFLMKQRQYPIMYLLLMDIIYVTYVWGVHQACAHLCVLI